MVVRKTEFVKSRGPLSGLELSKLDDEDVSGQPTQILCPLKPVGANQPARSPRFGHGFRCPDRQHAAPDGHNGQGRKLGH